MGREIDLLSNYPKANRNVAERGAGKTDEQRAIARQFGREFFDGERETGYGGFSYQPRFWQPVIPTFVEHFDLTADSSLLDIGCAKGFMLYDLQLALPGITLAGIDVSEYAIAEGLPEVAPVMQVADAEALPFANDSFDVVISINTVHNLDREGCAAALKEIARVAKHGSFITVDAYRDETEHERMMDWNLTAKTIMSTQAWVAFFDEVGYTGDYYWFMP
ncbi:MAG: class I SAM-dependent methyltransferase [Actinomycetota bacterium]|nr:class I SAM-dependent methyltransferase [Actinomycetota bacterium]